MQVCQSTGFSYIKWDETQQSQLTFGERLSNAIDYALESFDHIIVLGNDCPSLSTADLNQAAHFLQESKNIIGITSKGGTYLFTISKCQWNKSTFEKLSWCSSYIANDLIDYLSIGNNYQILDIKNDLNVFSDIYKFVKYSLGPLACIISALINNTLPLNYVHLFMAPIESSGISLRAPPSFKNPFVA